MFPNADVDVTALSSNDKNTILFYHYHLVNTSVGGVLVSPRVSSAQ